MSWQERTAAGVWGAPRSGHRDRRRRRAPARGRAAAARPVAVPPTSRSSG
ncbi:hypothetical protein LT493_20380 [Streptomyces tricolor]|nr:hypothetical protein [Streptomyces tricolor]